MRNLLLIPALFILSLFAQIGPQPIAIPVSTEWKFGPSSGMMNGSAAAGYGGSFSQVLTTTPAQLQEFKPGLRMFL